VFSKDEVIKIFCKIDDFAKNSHKVFNGFTERGKSSMGWFYGFKLHMVYNENGELLSFYLTKGNVYDRNPKHIKRLCKELFGKLFAGSQRFKSQKS